MKSSLRHLLPLLATLVLAPLVFVSCADEQVDDADDDLEIVAKAPWKCGRTMAGRANTDIAVEEANYPNLLHITVGDGKDKRRPTSHPETFIIGKNGDNDNTGYTAYHDQYHVEKIKFDATGLHASITGGSPEIRSIYSKSVITGLSIEANTLSPRYDGTQSNIPQAWDDADINTASYIDHLTTKAEFGGETHIDGKHLLITLGHVNAMLRLHFAVSKEYDNLRYIDLKSVSIAGIPVIVSTAPTTDLASKGHLILPVAATTKDYSQHTLFGSAFIKPSHNNKGTLIANIPSTPLNAVTTPWSGAVTTTTPLTFTCTYDIYDKDAGKIVGFTQGGAPTQDALTAASPHLTRSNVTATNTVTLNKLLVNGNAVGQIRAGYYYDLYITINPDYLYVLSEHDNKHMTIQ